MAPAPNFDWNPNSTSNALQGKAVAKPVVSDRETKYVRHIPSGIPKGWPKHLESALAWKNGTFDTEADFIYTLSGDEIMEAESALAHFKCTTLF